MHPTDTQRTGLAALQNASAKAADVLAASCRIDEAATPSARLAAVGKRLDVMLEQVKLVRTALDDFYAMLSDEQKAQFEAIGPRRGSSADRADMMTRRGRGKLGGGDNACDPGLLSGITECRTKGPPNERQSGFVGFRRARRRNRHVKSSRGEQRL